MSYDLADLEKWRRVPSNATGLIFTNDLPREVRLQVLAEQPTRLYVEHGEHRHFIGIVCGYEVIKFQMTGPFSLVADAVGCVVWTPEIESAGAVEIPEAVSFTTMMTRRQRNPQLEMMMHKMQQNMERRIARTERDLQLRFNPERRIADLEKKLEEFNAATEAQRRTILAPGEVPDDLPDVEPADAGAGDGDGLQDGGSKSRRSAVAKKPKS